jgi:hypothetical protein
MKIGIVGAEERKWTKEQKEEVIKQIYSILQQNNRNVLVSGHSPKGGVDIWAEDIARELELEMHIYFPENNQWEPDGYKERNKLIAKDSDIVYVFSPHNDWNGGLWTANYAESLGKEARRVFL